MNSAKLSARLVAAPPLPVNELLVDTSRRYPVALAEASQLASNWEPCTPLAAWMTGGRSTAPGSKTAMFTPWVTETCASNAMKVAVNRPVLAGVHVKVLWMGAVPLTVGKLAPAGAALV